MLHNLSWSTIKRKYAFWRPPCTRSTYARTNRYLRMWDSLYLRSSFLSADLEQTWEFKRSKSVFQFSRKTTCSRCSCALVNNRVAKVAWLCKQRSLESFDQDKNMKSRMNDGIWKEWCFFGIRWLSLISIIGTAGVLVLIKISNCLHVTSLEMVYLCSLLSFLSLSQRDQLHLISDHPLYAW